ncbi:MAG: hypothetical protein ABI193_18080 [Minicystis sp.]
MSTIARIQRAGALATLLATPLGCREPTEAVLDITTDGDCKEVGGTGITPGPIGAIESRPFATTTSSCTNGEIGSMVLVPPDGPKDTPFAFKVVTSLGTPIENCTGPTYGEGCIVSRRAMRFVPHHAFHVPVRMSQACAGVSCPEDQTCVDGICRSVTVDPNGCDDPAGCEPDPTDIPIFQTQFGGAGQQMARHLALGDDGALALVGNFDGELDLGGGALMHQGGSDIFLASFSHAGVHRWSRSFGGDGMDEGVAVATDAHSSVYLAASFEQTIDFGGGPLKSKGSTDVALVKLTSFGTLVWAIRFGGLLGDAPAKVVADSKGNVHVVGHFTGAMIVGNTTLTAVGGTDIFLASFDSSGKSRWAKSFGGPEDDGANGVGIDADDNIYLAGYFRGDLAIDEATKLHSLGTGDVLVASFNKDGAPRWAKSFGGKANDLALDLAARDDRIVVTGTLASKATLDGTTIPAGPADGFVTSFEKDGTLAWAASFGGEGNDRGSSVAIAPDGSLVIGGDTYSGSIFNAAPTKPRGVISPFVAVLERNGTPRWAKTFASALFASTTGVGAPKDGAAFLAGWFADALDADGTPFKSKGAEDLMLLRVEAP